MSLAVLAAAERAFVLRCEAADIVGDPLFPPGQVLATFAEVRGALWVTTAAYAWMGARQRRVRLEDEHALGGVIERAKDAEAEARDAFCSALDVLAEWAARL